MISIRVGFGDRVPDTLDRKIAARFYVREISMFSELMLSRIACGIEIKEVIIFLSYILVCAALFKSRFSRTATVLALSAAGIVITGANIAGMMSGDENLILTLFPLTAYLPFSVLLYFLSDSGIFETAAVCSVGTIEVLILRSLQKILIGTVAAENGIEQFHYIEHIIIDVIVVLAAAGLVFIAFRFIGSAFRFCIAENRPDRLLISMPVIMIFLMMLYYLNSTTNAITLIFTMLTALSIFFVIAKLLSSSAELIRARRSEKELSEYIDIQRRGYDRVVQKMESTREYRHDMRHHLAVIEGLAKQGECDKIIEYTNNLNGSFGKLAGMSYCKNPEINAILSEYIGRAESAGCRVTQDLKLPEMLPFEENDVCLVLANTIENAINACSELPEEKRYINISAEYADGHRLLVSVKNPCSHTVEFDENGSPVTDGSSDEHGIGLRSVKRIAEKYNGFMRCMLENGEFVFQAVLFYDNGTAKRKENRLGSLPKRAMSSLLGLGLGAIVMLNVLPSAAEAASEVLSVNIRTIRNLALGWGDNSISIESPEFDGNGELNGAVKNYTDEAKEKFLWYFNRRYNGYVAEDMTYLVIRDDEKLFIVQFNVTINAGGSFDYSRWIVFDKSAGKVLELSDLFKEGSDYIGVISAEILKEMKRQNDEYNYGYFVDGDDAFTEIREDVNFYIDGFDRIVIVFDEYEVAPGAMGSPKFFINKKVVEDIRR